MLWQTHGKKICTLQGCFDSRITECFCFFSPKGDNIIRCILYILIHSHTHIHVKVHMYIQATWVLCVPSCVCIFHSFSTTMSCGLQHVKQTSREKFFPSILNVKSE